MKRLFDLTVSGFGLLVLWPAIILLIWLVRRSSDGPGLFRQERIGKDGKKFVCVKLRTMKSGTRHLPSHEVSHSAVTPLGSFLRRTKLDELPQLYNVFLGDMSLVGPRPCLPTQVELIEARRASGAFSVLPGITGLAQIQDIDMSNPERLARVDGEYVRDRSLLGDLTIIWRTLVGHGMAVDRVKSVQTSNAIYPLSESGTLLQAVGTRQKIIVTGASGFVGREVVACLGRRPDTAVIGLYRSAESAGASPCLSVIAEDLLAEENRQRLADVLRGAKAVLHLAAATPSPALSEAEFTRTNVELTKTLAAAAAASGVERFVFVSSAGVHGAVTGASPLSEASPLNATDAYARSKRLAEAAVVDAAGRGAMAFTIVRPPLVYGPGARRMLGLLAKSVKKGFPLPLGAATANRRDMIGVGNLAAFLDLVLDHPNAINETFLICDGSPVSTRELIEAMAWSCGRRARLIPVPLSLLRKFAALSGRAALLERLIGNYEIDCAKARSLLQWESPNPLSHDLRSRPLDRGPPGQNRPSRPGSAALRRRSPS
jgi:O-antigen biosynthesis protein WbqP